MIRTEVMKDLSSQLKEISKDLTFLAHPRYPLRELKLLFPQHRHFLDILTDSSVPFPVVIDDKKQLLDHFFKTLKKAEIPEDFRKIFFTRARDYQSLVKMIEEYGKEGFYQEVVKLYGKSDEFINNPAFPKFISEIQKECHPTTSHLRISASEGMEYLQKKLEEVFDFGDFEIRASSSLLSDSSSGRKSVKLNPHKDYFKEELDIFLVHEGWAHLGTSLNGRFQHQLPWTSTWAPGTVSLQEGLAVCVEFISHKMTLQRWNKIVLRHVATAMAENGTPIQDLYQYLLSRDLDDLDALKLCLRIYRGVPVEGGYAFTKELAYLHGLIKLVLHLKETGGSFRSLWLGKISFEEHKVLLKNWDLLNPVIRYYPRELDSTEAQKRIEELSKLVHPFGIQGQET